MQRNLIPPRTWRVVCLLDNYLAFLPLEGSRHNVRWDPADRIRRRVSDRMPGRPRLLAGNIQSDQPTDRAKKLRVSSIGTAPSD